MVIVELSQLTWKKIYHNWILVLNVALKALLKDLKVDGVKAYGKKKEKLREAEKYLPKIGIFFI